MLEPEERHGGLLEWMRHVRLEGEFDHATERRCRAGCPAPVQILRVDLTLWGRRSHL